MAVIPHMVKGLCFGAKEGEGVAACRTANGWSAPAFITISGGSWGLQMGVEAVDVVLILQNDKGMQRLLSSNFQIGGDSSAAAGQLDDMPRLVGLEDDTGILAYSRAKGAFAGLTWKVYRSIKTMIHAAIYRRQRYASGFAIRKSAGSSRG